MTIVSMVPTISPKKIVIANATQKTSWSIGNTPSTVVPAALTTGFRRRHGRFDDRVVRGEPLGKIRIHLVQQHDGVLDHHSRQAHGSQQRDETERRPGHQQPGRDPDHHERDDQDADQHRAGIR